jgi:transcriptional regulator with XRE-family HTH domain
MRRALARRDIAEVFRQLQKDGVTQRRIARLTGLSSSEVYEVLRGRRVSAYDVLCRIADGLGVPRGYLGLSYDPETQALMVGPPTRGDALTERTEVRLLLSHAADMTMGITEGNRAHHWDTRGDHSTPIPQRVSAIDVAQIEQVTEELRALDYRYGGGACREAVIGQTQWVARLLATPAADDVKRRLHLTLADLHNLAGWTSHDLGLDAPARRHFAHAITHSRHADAPSLLANVLYRTGRLHLHRGLTHEALRFFQLGQIAAQDSGDALTVAVLCANEAWAYAGLGDGGQATKSLHRAADELARADPATAAPWVRFFGPADLDAMTGMTHLDLSGAASSERTARQQRVHVTSARTSLALAIDARDESMTRSRAFETTALAIACLRDGDDADGLRHGRAAAELAGQLRSARVLDRLTPLIQEAATSTSSDVQDLAHHLTGLQSST